MYYGVNSSPSRLPRLELFPSLPSPWLYFNPDREGLAMAKKPLDEWREKARAELEGAPPEDLAWSTPEGIPLKSLYTARDLDGMEHIDTLPGSGLVSGGGAAGAGGAGAAGAPVGTASLFSK